VWAASWPTIQVKDPFCSFVERGSPHVLEDIYTLSLANSSSHSWAKASHTNPINSRQAYHNESAVSWPTFQVTDFLCNFVERGNRHALDSIAQASFANMSSHSWSKSSQMNPIDSSLEIRSESSSSCLLRCVMTHLPSEDPLCSLVWDKTIPMFSAVFLELAAWQTFTPIFPYR